MKKTILTLLVALTATISFAKDYKTVVLTTQPVMKCENCEKKIKNNLKFEKGIKEIETNRDAQTVTVKYDGNKTSEEKIVAALGKIGYTASKPNSGCKDCKKAGTQQCGKEQKQCGQGAGCCKGKANGGGCCKQQAAANGEKSEGKPCCKNKGNGEKPEGAACGKMGEGKGQPKGCEDVKKNEQCGPLEK